MMTLFFLYLLNMCAVIAILVMFVNIIRDRNVFMQAFLAGDGFSLFLLLLIVCGIIRMMNRLDHVIQLLDNDE